MPRVIFQNCSICGKRLIKRNPNGLWHFVFGGNRNDPNDPGGPPVELFIHGSIKMRCLRRSCRLEHPNHYNVFNFFPHSMGTIAPHNRKPTDKEKPIDLGQVESSGIAKDALIKLND